MVKIVIEADDEMRKLVRQEVAGAIVSVGNAKTNELLEEGIRRALGKDQIVVTERICLIVRAMIDEALKTEHTSVWLEIKKQVATCVTELIKDEVIKSIAAELATIDIAGKVRTILEKRIDNIRIG